MSMWNVEYLGRTDGGIPRTMWQTARKIWSFNFLGARRDVTTKKKCLKTHQSFITCLMICVYTRLAKLFCHQRLKKRPVSSWIFVAALWFIFSPEGIWINMFPGMACSELEFAIRSLGFPVSYDEVQDWLHWSFLDANTMAISDISLKSRASNQRYSWGFI